MKNSIEAKLRTALLIAVGVLVAVLLGYAGITPNLELTEARKASGYTVVQDVSCTETRNADGALVRLFRFALSDEIACDATLAFFFSHQNAAVYLDGEQIYSLQSAPQLSLIQTPGSAWAMIPLYREDTGREVLVELTPVYENYQEQEIEFLIGSRYAICEKQLLRSLPELLLSFVNILAGLVLLLAAVYFSCKHVQGQGLYALALLAISLGLWNFTQTRFAPILLEGKTTFLYYISLTMLMVCILPLLQSIRKPEKKCLQTALNCLFFAACLLDIVQLLLQLTGVLDLRQTLTLTHGMLILGAVALVLSSFISQLRALRMGVKRSDSYIWILGIGVLVDLVLYYFSGNSVGLPVTLFAMLLYVLSEGAHLFIRYARQQHMLEEKENQLTMSRVTTMMSQIRSHFVFNILNAISGMCKYDPEKADETVVRFSRYLRNNIDIMEDDRSISFAMELERLEDYVILEQVRFGDRIRFETDIETDGFLLPPLILQPVVENAIKHGLSPKEEGGTIRLRTRQTEHDIVITVEDDGAGFDMDAPERSSSVGLRNIRFRLEHLVNGQLTLDSAPGRGTIVTITIPREKAI